MLRYLPTNLTAPEIASELYVSRDTVKTDMRNLYAKLGTHRRSEAVEDARPGPARALRTPPLSEPCRAAARSRKDRVLARALFRGL